MKSILSTLGFLFVASTISIVAQAQSTNGLTAAYPFAGNVLDASTNGNNGQIVGNVTLTSDRFNSTNCAYLFAGDTGSYISVQASGSFNQLPTNAFSVSLWYQGATTSMGDLECLFGQRNSFNFSGYNYILGLYDLNRLNFGNAWEPDVLVDTGNWHHVVGVYDSGYFSIYKDKQLISSEFTGLITTVAQDMVIGRGFHGAIDDVLFYNRAIDSTDIAQIFALPSSCATIDVKAPHKNELSIEMYPNPANDKINISLKGIEGNIDLILLNAIGQTIWTATVSGISNQIVNLNKWPSGLYMLKVMQHHQTIGSAKLMKL